MTTKLVTDYVSTLGNKGGNDKKGKQTQPAPAKKGGKAAKKVIHFEYFESFVILFEGW